MGGRDAASGRADLFLAVTLLAMLPLVAAVVIAAERGG